MKLTKPTVSQIWNALKSYRIAVNPRANRESLNTETVSLPDSQGSTPPSSQETGNTQSQRSTVSLGSTSGEFIPPFLEVCLFMTIFILPLPHSITLDLYFVKK